MELVAVINERLAMLAMMKNEGSRGRGWANHEKGPNGVVEEDDGGGHEHGEADDFVQLKDAALALEQHGGVRMVRGARRVGGLPCRLKNCRPLPRKCSNGCMLFKVLLKISRSSSESGRGRGFVLCAGKRSVGSWRLRGLREGVHVVRTGLW